MVRLYFSLVWLGLIWFGCFPFLKKKHEDNTGGERKLVGKRSGEKPAGIRPSGEKSLGKRPAGGENKREKDLAPIRIIAGATASLQISQFFHNTLNKLL